MQQRDMGVPLCANVDAETQGMIFRKTEVIRSSFIHEGEAAGRSPVPGIRRKHIQNGLQLCQESGLFFGLLAFINVDSHLPPAGFVHRPSGVAAPMANSFALDTLRQAILSQKTRESHGPSTRSSSHAAPSV